MSRLKPIPGARHTLGPWRVKEIDHSGARIAFGMVGSGCKIYGAPDREANALLIAASPDLLSLCVRALDALASNGMKNATVARDIRAAIAKVQA